MADEAAAWTPPPSPFAGMGTPASPFTSAPATLPTSTALIDKQASSTKKINVIAPDGESVYSLPENEIPQALAQGFKPESPEGKVVREYLEANPGLQGDAKVAWRSFVNQLAFGVPEIVQQKTGWDASDVVSPLGSKADPFSYAKSEALAKRHTFASLMGGLGGFAGSMLVGGPLFKAAGKAGAAVEGLVGGGGKAVAAETVERALTYRLGEGAAEFATTTAGKEAVKRAAPEIARAYAASIAGGATEGLIYGAPQILTEAALGDKKAAAEALYWNVGAGALFGAFGRFGHEVMAAQKKGVAPPAPIPEGLLPGEAAVPSMKAVPKVDALTHISNESAVSALGPLKKYADKLEGQVGVDFAGEVMHKYDLVQFGKNDARAISAKAEAAKETVGKSLQPYWDKVSALPDGTPLNIVKRDEVIARIEKDVLGALEAKTGFQTERAQVKAHIADMKATMPEAETLSEFWKRRKDLDDKIFKHDVAKSLDAIPEQLKQIRAIYRSTLEDGMDKAATILGDAAMSTERAGMLGMTSDVQAMKNLSREYATLAIIQKAAEKNIGRGMANRNIGLLDTIIGGAGTVAGSLLGGIGGGIAGGLVSHGVAKVLRENSMGAISHLTRALAQTNGITLAERAMANAGGEIARAGTTLAEMGARTKGGPPALSPAAIFSRFLPPHQQSDDKYVAFATLRKLVNERRDNPAATEALLDGIVAPWVRDAPETAAMLKAQYKLALGLMDKALPPLPTKAPLGGAAPMPPAKALKDAAAQLEILENPGALVDHMKKKSVQKPHLNMVQAAYEKWHRALGDHLIDTSATGDHKMPFAARTSVGQIAPTVVQGHNVPALQKTYSSGQALGEARGRPPSGGALSKSLKASAPLTEISRVTHR
jgi:hypothetical protein